jgi:glycosyltransferase involved in cell wall biosynthesis
MNIGLITTGIDQKNPSYTTVIRGLLGEMKRLRPDHRFTVVHHTRLDHDVYRDNPEVILPRRSFKPLRPPWGIDFKKNKLQGVPVDLMHDLGASLAFSARMPFKKVVNIHDLASLILPHITWRGRISYLLLGRRLVKRVDKITTVSESSKRHIIQFLKASPDRVEVVYNGVGSQYAPRPAAEIARFKKEKSVDFPFLLYLGVLQPRKNIPTLLRAYAKLKASGLKHHLVIAGGKGWHYEEIFRLVGELRLENDILFTGHVPDADVPLWYGAADLFVFPSIFEGFGIPPLEAMACGTPVVTTNVSSLPEVVGDAALTVDPHNVEALAGAIHRLLHDVDLRTRLREMGFARARMFTWERAAEKTLRIYDQLLA